MVVYADGIGIDVPAITRQFHSTDRCLSIFIQVWKITIDINGKLRDSGMIGYKFFSSQSLIINVDIL